ncbi:hypothetical protein L6R52_31180 [Myxococcota bacterium]|nr:hypothetical protein [Myxococcota bacterium]
MSHRRAAIDAPVAASLVAMTVISACSRSQTFKLPETPSAELAFAVLYGAGDRAVEAGPVVRRQTLYAGRYTIASSSPDLVPRLFFVELDALEAAARDACAELPTKAQQLACADLVGTCAADPVACLSVKLSPETCEDRLTLPRSMPLEVYGSDGERLERVADTQGLTDDLVLCGPSIERGCPNLLPGYALTEGGALRCTVPLVQLACTAKLDLSACGLGRAEGTLAADGTFSGTFTERSSCVISALDAADAPLGARTASFAITCGGRRFVASPMELLFGEPSCPERGPPVFHDDGLRGRLTGLAPIRPDGWSPRYVAVGSGYDACALRGCSFGGEGCERGCADSCNVFVDLFDCAGANETAACAPQTSSEACLERCIDVCRANEEGCIGRSQGETLTLSSPDDIERITGAFDLDAAARDRPLDGARGLVVLGDRAAPAIVVATGDSLRTYAPEALDVLTQVVAPVRPGFSLAGITRLGDRGDAIVAFGQGTDGGRVAIYELLQLSETERSLVPRDVTFTSVLPQVDDVAIAGPASSWIFGVALDPPLGVEDVARVDVATVDGTEAPAPLELPGPPTAIAALSGGDLAVAIAPTATEAGRVLLFTPDVDRMREVAQLPIAGGLVVRAILADEASCATEARCRVYVGYEREDASRQQGPALVGVLEHDRTMPEASRVVPTFVETGAEELTFLVLDPARNTLLAVASRRDRVHPITMVR